MKSLDKITSVLEGSVRHHTEARPVWLPGADPDLRALVEGGSCVCVVGRNSASSGEKGVELSARDAVEAVTEVLLAAGMDIRGCLPSLDVIRDAIRKSSNVLGSVTSEGKGFNNRFVVIDVRECGFILSISCGSAYKLDAEYDQPHVEWLRMLLKDPELKVKGLVAKRFDRLVRDDSAIFPLRKYAQSKGVWISEGTHHRWDYSDGEDFSILATGKAARREAEENSAKRSRGYRASTAVEMVDGRVAFGAGYSCPAGAFRYRDSLTHASMLAVDDVRRPKGAVQGLPAVVDGDGDPVFQADNVMWALSQFGGVLSKTDVMAELLRRRYSTANLREMRGQDMSSFYGGPSRPDSDWSASKLGDRADGILNNLDFYRTGRLVVEVGDGKAPIVVENVFPVGGRWASEEDFERIDRWKAGYAPQRRRSAWSWTQMPITVNGVPAVLRPLGHTEYRDGAEVRWAIHSEDSAVLSAAVPGRVPTVPDDVLVATIVGGVVAADGEPLRPFVVGSGVDDVSLWREEEGMLRDELSGLRLRVSELRGQLDERDPDTGDRLITGFLLRDLNKEYGAAVEGAEARAARLKVVEEKLASPVPETVGVSVDELTAVVNGLTDPRTNDYRTSLRQAVQDLRLEVREVSSPMGIRGFVNELSGRLVLRTRSGAWEVEFRGVFETGSIAGLADRVARAERGLREGRVTKFVLQGSDEYRVLREMVAGLGFDESRFALRNCYDSALLRVGMAVVSPPSEGSGFPTLEDLVADEGLRERFGDVAALGRRAAEVYVGTDRAVWLITTHSPQVVERLITQAQRQAARADTEGVRLLPCLRWGSRRWQLGRGAEPALLPCVRCGSCVASPMRVPEVTGYVCLNPVCRFDEAGVRWPSDYDRYICSPQLWVAAGVELDIPVGYTGSKEDLAAISEVPDPSELRLKRPLRKAVDFTAEQRAQVVAEYRDGTDPGTTIARRWRTPYAELLEVIESEGVARRASAYRQRPAPADLAGRDTLAG